MAQPLMPKATAVWLIDNTSLTFEQIADVCGLHILEVQGIADGEVAVGILGLDPVASGQIQREDIERCEKDPAARLTVTPSEVPVHAKRRKGPRYTPVSRRQDRPNGIAWLLKYHPELSDPQIAKLLGTTKTTIQAVRGRTHWNSSNIKAEDPVLLGICTQTELETEVQKARNSVRVAAPSGESEQASD